MKENWKTYKLSEVAEIVGGGTPSTNVAEYWDGEIPWLTPRDLTNYNFKFISKGARLITEEGLKNSSAKLIPEGSVLLTSRAPIGYLAIAENEVCTNQGFKSFIADENKLDNQFLYYLLKNNVEYLKSLGTGTTFAEVSASALRNLEFNFPDLKTQTEIISILSSLDNKIELNLQMSQTLEAMAQAIFQEWFVKFQFPNFDGVMENDLPKGWKKGSVLEIANLLSGGTPKTEIEKYWNGNIKWISAKDITSNNKSFILSTEKQITEDGMKNSAAKLLPKFTTVISARGTVGNYCILPEEMTISQSNYGLKAKSNQDDFFLFLLVENMIEMMKQFSYGTIFDTITTKTFHQMEVVIPSKKIIGQFDEIIKPFFGKKLCIAEQNQTLIQLRDSLLPKLMTGKIQVQA